MTKYTVIIGNDRYATLEVDNKMITLKTKLDSDPPDIREFWDLFKPNLIKIEQINDIL